MSTKQEQNGRNKFVRISSDARVRRFLHGLPFDSGPGSAKAICVAVGPSAGRGYYRDDTINGDRRHVCAAAFSPSFPLSFSVFSSRFSLLSSLRWSASGCVASARACVCTRRPRRGRVCFRRFCERKIVYIARFARRRPANEPPSRRPVHLPRRIHNSPVFALSYLLRRRSRLDVFYFFFPPRLVPPPSFFAALVNSGR